MKWNRGFLTKSSNEGFLFEESISFDKNAFENCSIKGLEDVIVKGCGNYDPSTARLIVDLDIQGVMILPCSRTLDDVQYHFSVNDTLIYSFNKVDDDEDVIEVKGDVVDIMPQVFQLIMFEVPLRVVKEGSELQRSGNGWQVISQQELKKSKQDQIDPRLAKLKDYFKQDE